MARVALLKPRGENFLLLPFLLFHNMHESNTEFFLHMQVVIHNCDFLVVSILVTYNQKLYYDFDQRFYIETEWNARPSCRNVFLKF